MWLKRFWEWCIYKRGKPFLAHKFKLVNKEVWLKLKKYMTTNNIVIKFIAGVVIIDLDKISKDDMDKINEIIDK